MFDQSRLERFARVKRSRLLGSQVSYKVNKSAVNNAQKIDIIVITCKNQTRLFLILVKSRYKFYNICHLGANAIKHYFPYLTSGKIS